MKTGNILLIAGHAFRDKFQSNLYKKVNLILVGVFTLLVFVMWPGGIRLTYGIPQRFDVGYTLLLILSIVFITQYLTSFNIVNSNGRFTNNMEDNYSSLESLKFHNKISLREKIIGESLSAVVLIFIYIITLLPHGVILYYCGYFRFNDLLQLYAVTIMMVIAFIMFEGIITFMVDNEVTAGIVRIVISGGYVAGLILTQELTPVEIHLNLLFHLLFTGIIGGIYVFMITTEV